MEIILPRKLVHAVATLTTLDLLFLGSIWVGQSLLVNPVGNFPLNDDWSYSRAVYALVVHRNFQLSGFTAMPLIAQVLWGALFCLVAGFSFTVLRISTLVLGYIGVSATYHLIKEARADRIIALLAALLVATNPLYFSLSFTFMTDVPFFAVAILAVLFLLRGVRLNSGNLLLTGFFLTLAALFIRQLAVLIPLSFAAASLLTYGITRKNILWTLPPAILAPCILAGYQLLLHETIGVPKLYNRGFDPIIESSTSLLQFFGIALDRFFIAALYLGLFLLPITLVLSVRRLEILAAAPRLRYAAWTAVLSGLVIVGLFRAGRIMPLSGNILFNLGLGPVLLQDVYLHGLPHYPKAPSVFWMVVTAVSAVGGVLLVQLLVVTGLPWVRRVLKGEQAQVQFPAAFAFTFSALYLGAIVVTGYLDRYFLLALPLLMLGFAARDMDSIDSPKTQPRQSNSSRLVIPGLHEAPSRAALNFAVLLLLLYGSFSLTATHDYLSWNRARWSALNHLLMDSHISYNEIDGGFEFNGWYAYNPRYQQLPGKSWWWVHNDEYVLSFGPLEGYRTAGLYPYSRWLPIGKGYIFVLRLIDQN